MRAIGFGIWCGVLASVTLADGPVCAHSSMSHLAIGAKVVSPCTVATGPRNSAVPRIVCAAAVSGKPEIVNEANPQRLGNAAGETGDARQDDSAPLRMEIIF